MLDNLLIQIKSGKIEKVRRTLHSSSFDKSCEDYCHLAVSCDFHDIFTFLAEEGFNTSMAALIAAKSNALESLKVCIERKLNLFYSHESILSKASKVGNVAMVILLNKMGFSDAEREQAQLDAIFCGELHISDYFVEQGFTINNKDVDIEILGFKGLSDSIKYLKEKGANLTNVETALFFAEMQNHYNISLLFEDTASLAA